MINTVQKGITVGIPTLGRSVSLDWAFAYKSLIPPINFHMITAIVQNKPVDIARNEIVAHALNANHKYVYFMGDDTVPPHNIMKQLIYRAENNKDHGVITGVYCSKSVPTAPLLFRGNGVGSYWDWKVGEYFEITGCGMDAVLLRTDVFRQLIPFVGKDKQGNYQFYKTVEEDQFEDGINDASLWTEDLYFLNLVEKHTDFKIFCDGGMLCDHVDVATGKIYRLPQDCYPVTGIKELEAKGLKKALDVGCGPRGNWAKLGDEYKVVRVDIRDECEPDYRCDVRILPFEKNSFDLVYSSHVLEHFGRNEWQDVLKEWVRVLKNDGTLLLVLPNINWAIEQFKKGVALNPDVQPHVWNVLYGGQSNPYDFHYNGWTEDTLQKALEDLGFNEFDWQSANYNMIVTANKKV